jgi:peptidyl-prolyl cis-trans isomerase D
MRRLGAVLLVLSLVACGPLRDMFSAHADDAATAAGQTLGAAQLADWASQVKGMPMQSDNLTRFARIWVDYTLFAGALAGGNHLDDSALVIRTMWPIVSQAKWEHFRDRLVAGRTALSRSQVDSAFNLGQVRAFQHILLQVPANATPDVSARTKAKLQGILQQIQAAHGTNFAAMARKYSEDGSKQSGGYLGVYPKGHFVAPFEYAAWQLAPGEISAVVQSPFGFHVIRRLPLSEVRDSFTVSVQESMEQTFDSTYFARVRELRHISVSSQAPAAVRAALQDVDASEGISTKLVSYDGGGFRISDLVRWVRALPPQTASAIPGAGDAQLNKILETLATRDILLQQADSARVGLTPDDWHEIKAGYDTALGRMEDMLHLSATTLRDSGGTPAARTAFASTHVNEYLDGVVTRRAPFLPVPPFLASSLRSSGDWHLNTAGIERATQKAQEIRTAMGGGPSGPGTGGQPLVRPAPGPAPTPGGGADTAKPQGAHK